MQPIRTIHAHAEPRSAAVLALHRTSQRFLLPAVLITVLLLLATWPAKAQLVINTSGGAPTSDNAILELNPTVGSLPLGLLVPRVTRSERNSIANPPLTVAPDGLLVYQTDNQGTELSGFYYFDATVLPMATGPIGWVHLGFGGRVWQLGGNAGTNMNNDFLGTVNNYPLVLRTRNREAGRLTEGGKLQLYGGAYPAGLFGVYPSALNTEMVHVQGAVKLNGGNNPANTNAANLAGTIRFTPGTGGAQSRFEGYVVNTGSNTAATSGWKQIDNNFHVRKLQESTNMAGGCMDPTNTSATFGGSGAPGINPRPWPTTGPASGFLSLGGGRAPYYGLWEDSRQQYLYLADDLSATGMCPGPDNPIRAIAFNVASVGYGGATRAHFPYLRVKNTATATVTAYDNAGLVPFSEPTVGQNPGPPVSYPNHNAGVQPVVGWFVHPYSFGPPGTGVSWAGQNLLIDFSTDNQDWPIIEANVQGYNTGYPSMIYMYCDACGGSGGSPGAGSCQWRNPPPAGFYFPPTAPFVPGAGSPGTPGGNVDGWGYGASRTLTNGMSTVACDGQTTTWGGFGPSIVNQLPRVAFLAKYVGGGMAYNVGEYSYANEALLVGDATWAASGTYGPPSTLQHRGPGTINAQRSVWSDNQLLTDYVFDLYYDGVARPEDAKGANAYNRVPLRDLPNYVERHRKLPNVDGRQVWNTNGTFSLDKITNQLWIAVEDQALYIQELNERMDALRQYLVEKKLREGN